MQVVDIDRVIVATDNLDRTASHLTDLLGLRFGEQLNVTTETTAGEHELVSKISKGGAAIDLVAPTDIDADNAVAEFVRERGTGLYALALRVVDAEAAREELAAKGVKPVGEISAGDFTEYLYHPNDFEGLFIFLASFPHSYETNRLAELAER